MYVCDYVCTCSHTYIYIYIYMCVCVCVCVCVVCVCVCVCVFCVCVSVILANKSPPRLTERTLMYFGEILSIHLSFICLMMYKK